MATVNLLSFPFIETVSCPECSKPIKLYDPEGSEFCVCPSCHSFIRFSSIHSRGKAQKVLQSVKESPLIPLGTAGKLKDHPFKVIAYLERKEKGTTYTWQEYLLYNYEKGYATLSVYNGHWNIIVDKIWESTLEQTVSDSSVATLQGVDYKVFNKYTPITTALIGEFDWDVLSDNARTYEYIAPPLMISREGQGTYAQYYWGEYIEPREVAEAFGLDIDTFPEKIGIGANQPSAHTRDFGVLLMYSVLAVVAMLLFQVVVGMLKPEQELLNSDFDITFDKGPAQFDSTGVISSQTGTHEFRPFLTPSFKLADGPSPLEITVGSDVDNNWLEATVILINDQTNESWEVTKGIEYYHGWEDGESWSEGSNEMSIVLSAIPEGKYHLNIYPVSGDPSQTDVHIRVVSNVTLWRNIFMTILILCPYPLYCWFRMRTFEKRRWMNSDYSPFDS